MISPAIEYPATDELTVLKAAASDRTDLYNGAMTLGEVEVGRGVLAYSPKLGTFTLSTFSSGWTGTRLANTATIIATATVGSHNTVVHLKDFGICRRPNGEWAGIIPVPVRKDRIREFAEWFEAQGDIFRKELLEGMFPQYFGYPWMKSTRWA